MGLSKKAKELLVGEQIRVEYGSYGNFVNFYVDKATPVKGKMNVACHKDYIKEKFLLDAEADVEIVEEGV